MTVNCNPSSKCLARRPVCVCVSDFFFALYHWFWGRAWVLEEVDRLVGFWLTNALLAWGFRSMAKGPVLLNSSSNKKVLHYNHCRDKDSNNNNNNNNNNNRNGHLIKSDRHRPKHLNWIVLNCYCTEQSDKGEPRGGGKRGFRSRGKGWDRSREGERGLGVPSLRN